MATHSTGMGLAVFLSNFSQEMRPSHGFGVRVGGKSKEAAEGRGQVWDLLGEDLKQHHWDVGMLNATKGKWDREGWDGWEQHLEGVDWESQRCGLGVLG